jgi:hypothetical protein
MQRSGVNVPFGLYGMLLFALCWLTLPAVFAPIERWLLGTATWLPRAVAAWSGSPACVGSYLPRRGSTTFTMTRPTTTVISRAETAWKK